jgi:ubiquinone/menaquinone biosynthesis C-methylase UbiE
MTMIVQVGLALLALLLVGTAGWRLFSRRSSLPCPSWLSWMVELENPIARNVGAANIVRRLELQPGMRVLDAGCGPGRVTIPLAKALVPGGEVVAVDIQSEMLRRAREKARSADVTNIRFCQLAIEPGNLGSERYDRAILVTVLGEIPDRQGALEELYRALNPGGILSVTEMIFDPHYQSRRTILSLARAVGFQEKAFFGSREAYTLNLEK